jgi:hypothetical protein
MLDSGVSVHVVAEWIRDSPAVLLTAAAAVAELSKGVLRPNWVVSVSRSSPFYRHHLR